MVNSSPRDAEVFLDVLTGLPYHARYDYGLHDSIDGWVASLRTFPRLISGGIRCLGAILNGEY